jgi:V/A-type H+-transporting ATPase subunit F|tara:strand:+ start:1099 stop:1395 length:297 start_codon:yes stop_codon:yes gene_type:complete
MKIVALGSRAFVSGFMLSGVNGIQVSSSPEALQQIQSLVNDKEIGLVLISNDISGDISDQITDIRSEHPIPLIYEIPAPGTKAESVDYRELIKKVLKM